ncbi:alpha/beta hydrolase [Nocardia sp. 2]|uniref:Alpha/beta hydrolase n=1 Tax=Nocardia acididurans TaxID=2802282 RepID=A0ABS1M411_9NOCA|nr:alpha/beta hydrolase [Nocardia acididurans]MBL1075382.1 alpha/beta hydrolase [Nocardia acididurans]
MLTVTIEYPRRAGWIQRFAHPLSYAVLRQGMNVLVALAWRGIPIRGVRIFHLPNLLDPLLAPLVPIRGTTVRRIAFPRFRAEWVWHRDAVDPERREAAVLYFHGGGLVSCGLNSHRRLVSRISRAAGVPVFQVDYRQLPKAHVTETIEDCVEAYEYLLAQGFPADRIVLAGDSAGGGLAFRTAIEIRDRLLPTPGGIVGLAPWANYDSTLRFAHPNDRLDPMLGARALDTPAQLGLLRDGALDPAWSAVNHHFAGLPPVLIQVGSTEVLLADAHQLAERCEEAGVPCRMQVWDRAVHVFQAGADLLPDARQAIGVIGEFIRDRLTTPGTTQRTTAA